MAAFFGNKENGIEGGEGTLIQGMRFFLLLWMSLALAAAAQTPKGASPFFPQDSTSQGSTTISGGGISSIPDNPVDNVRKHQSWEFGPIANGGVGLGNRDTFRFFSLGFQGGKVLTPVIRAGIFSGQFEYAANIMPLWQAYTPAAGQQTYSYPLPSGGKGYSVGPFGGGTYTGVSLTPVIFRWNFLTGSRHLQPWFQGAGGIIYTTHKFPPDLLVPHGTSGGTSVFNFTPQGGGGLHYFIRPRRSIDFGVNAIHISSASLGDRNPGVNASLQFQMGYTFWK